MDERLISPRYAELNAELHRRSEGYGSSAGARWAEEVAALARREGITSLIDYGCGKGTLRQALGEIAPGLTVREYDPAIPGKDRVPRQTSELVVCLDVLEHVEEDRVPAVLDHLFSLAREAVFATVCTRAASEHKLLADGRNAHQTVRPLSWWVRRFQKRAAGEVEWRELGDGEIVLVARNKRRR